jgi:hypothetical protein
LLLMMMLLLLSKIVIIISIVIVIVTCRVAVLDRKARHGRLLCLFPHLCAEEYTT